MFSLSHRGFAEPSVPGSTVDFVNLTLHLCSVFDMDVFVWCFVIDQSCAAFGGAKLLDMLSKSVLTWMWIVADGLVGLLCVIS